MKHNLGHFLLMTWALAICLCTGCHTTDVADGEERPIPESVLKARGLFENDQLADAIIACTAIYRKDPLTPGLGQLQAEINERLAELRKQNTARRLPVSDAIAMEDVDRQGILPDTYRQRKHVVGESRPIHAMPPETQKLLDQPYTIHLDGVTLAEIVGQIGSSTNLAGINIVADSDLGEGKTISIHIDNAPLGEILEYIGRNMGVTFAVGRNLIWATEGNDSVSGPPLYTRIYRLRKGMSGKNMPLIKSEPLDSGSESSTERSKEDENRFTDSGKEILDIIDAVNRFVPETEGADILYNPRAHAILAKNTRENLSLIEDIIEVLDVRPHQVLIESRFITTEVTDLSELGVDWFLDSNWGQASGNGSRMRTRIIGQRGAAATGFTGASIEQTSFDSASSGLNLTYQGLLTDPQFHAVLHALQTEGNTRTLSVPRATVANNTIAEVFVGEDLYYFEEYDVEEIRTGTNSNGNETYESRLVPSGTPKKERVGIRLAVMPSIGADLSTTSLRLAPSISSFVRWEYWDTSVSSSSSTSTNTASAMGMIKMPIIDRSFIETDVIVRSGETVVMGGLAKSTHDVAQRGVPILSKIPLIGRLFRHDVTSEETSNLLIFVTATLISDTGEELIPVNPPEPVSSGGKVELGAR